MALLGEGEAEAEVVEQLVEVARGGGRRLPLQGEEAAHGRHAVALGQFDLAEQQVGNAGEAAEAELVEFRQRLLDVPAGGAQLAESEQAAGAVEAQHRAGGVALRMALQHLAGQHQAVAQVAAEKGQQGAQVGDGLLHPLGVARHALALQLAQALDAGLGAGDAGGHHDDGGLADRQGEVVAAVFPGNLAEQVDQRVDLAVAQQVEGMPLGGGQHRVEVAGAAVQATGVARLAAYWASRVVLP